MIPLLSCTKTHFPWSILYQWNTASCRNLSGQMVVTSFNLDWNVHFSHLNDSLCFSGYRLKFLLKLHIHCQRKDLIYNIYQQYREISRKQLQNVVSVLQVSVMTLISAHHDVVWVAFSNSLTFLKMTRMHSSRMRTVRSGGRLSGEVSAPGGGSLSLLPQQVSSMFCRKKCRHRRHCEKCSTHCRNEFHQ